MRRALGLLALIGLLQACTLAAPPGPVAPAAPMPTTAALPPDVAARNFRQVVQQVEPVAEAECRARRPGANCDFQIVVDDRPGQGVNAFQTLDPAGRPIIGFTIGLIADARNQDELAFVLGHEAAHHIEGHIPETQVQAQAGAVAGALLGAVLGRGDPDLIRQGADIGGFVGARRYSRDNELEADALGTIIAARAGFDPLRGAEFFNRIPDPGDQFLGSHPPNAERIAVVRQTAAGL